MGTESMEQMHRTIFLSIGEKKQMHRTIFLSIGEKMYNKTCTKIDATQKDNRLHRLRKNKNAVPTREKK